MTAEMIAPAWMHTQITAEQYDSWSEDQCAGIEIVDGMVVVSPSVSKRHNRLAGVLANALETAAGSEWNADIDFDVRLQDVPLTNRRPDVVVLPCGHHRRRTDPTLFVTIVIAVAAQSRRHSIESRDLDGMLVDTSGVEERSALSLSPLAVARGHTPVAHRHPQSLVVAHSQEKAGHVLAPATQRSPRRRTVAAPARHAGRGGGQFPRPQRLRPAR